MLSEHVVALVDFARLEPLSIGVLVDPSDDLAIDDYASGGRRIGVPRTEPALRHRVSSRNENITITRTRHAKGDPAVTSGAAR